MKEGICWIGYNRPEYAKASLESIFGAKDAPKNFHAYVDNDGTERSQELLKLLGSYCVENVTFRSSRFGCTPNVLHAFQDFFTREYDICHYVEEDIILSADFFNRSRESMKNEDIAVFCGCVVDDSQIRKKYSRFSAWGSSFRRILYDKMFPHIAPFLAAWEKNQTVQYQSQHFGVGTVDGFDGLIDRLMEFHKLIAEYPERSYSKDIGEFGLHRREGCPPTMTLEQWANEEPRGAWGYGINGILFEL